MINYKSLRETAEKAGNTAILELLDENERLRQKSMRRLEAYYHGFADGKEHERIGNHTCFVGCKIAACLNRDLRVKLAEATEALGAAVETFDKAKKYFKEQHDLDDAKAEYLGFGGDSYTRQTMYGANVWINVENYMVMLEGKIRPSRATLAKIGEKT